MSSTCPDMYDLFQSKIPDFVKMEMLSIIRQSLTAQAERSNTNLLQHLFKKRKSGYLAFRFAFLFGSLCNTSNLLLQITDFGFNFIGQSFVGDSCEKKIQFVLKAIPERLWSGWNGWSFNSRINDRRIYNRIYKSSFRNN